VTSGMDYHALHMETNPMVFYVLLVSHTNGISFLIQVLTSNGKILLKGGKGSGRFGCRFVQVSEL
jgi:hypothetical protein